MSNKEYTKSDVENSVLRLVATAKVKHPSEYTFVEALAKQKLLENLDKLSDWEYKIILAKVIRAISVRQEKMGYISNEYTLAKKMFEKFLFPKQALAPWMYALGYLTEGEVGNMLSLSKERYSDGDSETGRLANNLFPKTLSRWNIVNLFSRKK